MMRFFLLMFGLLSFHALGAQTITPQQIEESEISLSYRGSAYINPAQQLILRWAPEDLISWKAGADSGFVVIRTTVATPTGGLTPGAADSSRVVMTLLPKSQSLWQSAADTNDMSGLAAGALFGENFTVNGPSNGGVVTAYNIIAETQNRFGLSLFAADNNTYTAWLMNLIYVDVSVQPGWTYAYAVRPYGNTGFKRVNPATWVGKIEPSPALQAPAGLIAESGDRYIMLSWDKSDISYSSFNVFKAVGNGPFQKINDYPILPLEEEKGRKIFYKDSVSDNTTTFRYKIRGHSPFGIEGPFTAPVSQSGKPSPLAANVFIESVAEVNGSLLVKWTFPDSLNQKINGFNLYRRNQWEADSIGVKVNSGSLIGKTLRAYKDNQPGGANYYVVEAVDQNGNRLQSQSFLGQTKDEIPPAAPTGLSGVAVGQDGTLRLSWNSNQEPDVMGYRVFFSDQSNGEFLQITPNWISDTVLLFKIDPRTIAKFKYFKVKAIDYRENPSAFSAFAAVQLPDNHPPAPPVIKVAEARSSGNFIQWVPSMSDDVIVHRLLKRPSFEQAWTEVPLVETNVPNSILDTNVIPNYEYEYMMQAQDDSGKKSNSRIFKVKTLTNIIRPAVKDLSVVFVKSKSGIVVKWEYPDYYGLDVFVIYRDMNGRLIEVATVRPQDAAVGGVYVGSSTPPSGNAGNGGDWGQYQQGANPGQFANNVNFNQPGNQAAKTIRYQFVDRNFELYKEYGYTVCARFANGSSSTIIPSAFTKTY